VAGGKDSFSGRADCRVLRSTVFSVRGAPAPPDIAGSKPNGKNNAVGGESLSFLCVLRALSEVTSG